MAFTQEDRQYLAGLMDRQEQGFERRFNELEQKMATKDDLGRLERKMEHGFAVSRQHHMEAREMIGEINGRFVKLREGIIKAAQ